MTSAKDNCCTPPAIAEIDIGAAMKEMDGYLDISLGDFKEVYQMAYRHAVQRLADGRRAAEIMTSPVHCLQLTMDLVDAAEFLAAKQISGAPVVDEGGVIVGLVSEKDFLAKMGLGKTASFMQIIAHCLSGRACLARILRNQRLADFMTGPVVTGPPEISLGAISVLFTEKQINRLPIVDPAGRPLGIVSRGDIVRACSISTVKEGER